MLHVALDEACDDDKRRVLAPWALIGAASAYAVAVRRLVLSGLDGPARVVLRSLTETLFICIVLLDRDDLRAEYEAAHDLEAAYALWLRELGPRRIEQHLTNAEGRVASSSEVDWQEMAAWRHEQIGLMSQFVHLSYAPAVLTARPLWEGIHEPGLFGAPSSGSFLTLKEGTKSIWYLATVGFYHLFVKPDGLFAAIVAEPSFWSEPSWLNRAIVAGDVFSQLVLRHWDDEEGPAASGAVTD